MFFSGHCCAQYDAGIGRVVEDFNRPSHKLPFVYESDKFWESKMFRLKITNKITILHVSLYMYNIIP